MEQFDVDCYPKHSLRVAVAQTVSLSGDIGANVERSIPMIEYAIQRKADIIVFPEKFLTGYVPEIIISDPERYAVVPNDPRLEPIRSVCKQHKICAIIGTPTQLDGSLYISSIVIE
ncbi:nitrilase-related carbon-nitrogen hydrolase [Paenibacillus tarimensis]